MACGPYTTGHRPEPLADYLPISALICPPRCAAAPLPMAPAAQRDVAGDQTGAEAQQQAILFLDESGFYPLPSVVRTDAPVGQTPILWEWCIRDHLSATSAISPEGKVYFHSQGRALNAADVVAFLEHLRREVPGRMVMIWDGSPIHRSHTIKGFLANGAAQCLHLERLPSLCSGAEPG